MIKVSLADITKQVLFLAILRFTGRRIHYTLSTPTVAGNCHAVGCLSCNALLLAELHKGGKFFLVDIDV